MTTVRAAITQTTWTGDKESMLDKHEQFARDAAAQGAQVICFQELFYGPYFGITQDKKYYRLRRAGRWARSCSASRRSPKELGIVMVLPIYEEDRPACTTTPPCWSTPTARSSASTASTTCRTSTGSGRSSTSVRATSATPCSTRRSDEIGMYICYDRHFPEGWRELGLNGAHIVFNPNATKPGLSNRLWEVEGPAAAVANGYFVLQPNRVGREDNEYGDLAVDFYGTSQVIDPRGNFVGERGSGEHEEVLVRDLDMDMVREMRDDWQFYRDRRPDSYTRIAKP